MSKSCLKTPPTRGTSEGGFSLVEVLVSIVVLSFGMLGMVGLQAAALQSNRDAKAQSAAVTLARELAEMMRGNKIIGAAAANPYLGDFLSPLVPNTASYCLTATGSGCADPTAVANAQMTEWLARVESELPAPHVVVCADSAPYDAAGMPRWACSGSGPITYVKLGWTRNATKRSAAYVTAFDRAAAPSVVLPVTPGSVDL